MLNSTILEVIIGLVFLYLLFSLLATFVNELIFTFFKFRANHLKKTIQIMMDNNAEEGKALFNKFHQHPLIQSFLQKKGNGFPSYLDPEKFAAVIIEIYNEEKISKGKDSAKESIEKLPKNNYLRHILLRYIEQGEDKTLELETNLKNWFNSVMERASGWYNRSIKKWTIVIALVIVILFNFDSIKVYQRLSKDSKVRKELVKYADNNIEKYAEYIKIDSNNIETNKELLEEMDSLKNEINTIIKEEINSIEQLAGIGWTDGEIKTAIQDFWSFSCICRILGWFITALAISLGAPFWFDLLNKVMKLRGTGKQEEVPKS
ncbi:MAG TPA: hypothetical protein DCG75_14715 [Bacteroidales bacterium]|nr:hypothetical protein [Bacteroidales bacterium]